MTPDPDVFHDHLDACAQCREHPFDLCPTGAAILTGRAAAPAPSASPATPPCRACAVEADLGTEEVPHPVDARLHTCVAPASPATEDEALVDAFDEAAVACQAAADLASATALSERKETVRAALLDHLSALRRRAEEAEADAGRAL